MMISAGVTGYLLVAFSVLAGSALSSPVEKDCQLQTVVCRCKTAETVTLKRCVNQRKLSEESLCQSKETLALCNPGKRELNFFCHMQSLLAWYEVLPERNLA